MRLIAKPFDQPIHQTLRDKLGTVLFIACLALYIYLANKLRHGPEAGDETEKLVAALMIRNGGHLYCDVFSHHGPLSFMLAHVYLAITGIKNMGTYRLVPLLTSLGMIAAIFFSPVFNNSNQRKLAASITALGLAANQAIFGLIEGTYQIYAGHLLVCALALFALPVLFDSPLKRISAFLGGLAIGLAFFAAYSYVISCGCLFGICAYKIYGARREPVNIPWQWGSYALLGALLSVVIVFAWLLRFGDVVGYFVYHFYFNQFVYNHFIHFNPWRIFILMVPVVNYFYVNSVAPDGGTWPHSNSFWIDCTLFFCVLFYAVALWLLKRKNSKIPAWPAFGLLFLSMIYTDMRGVVGYQANTIAIVAVGFMGLAVAIILDGEKKEIFINRATKITTGMVMAVFLAAQFFAMCYAYDATPIHYYAYKNKDELGLSQAPAMQFIRSFVHPDETIEVLPADMSFYLQADRLPASGDFYYFPWQDAYFKKPILGYKIDLCHDIEQKKPKAILLQSISIWGYDNSTYLGCVQNILKKQYVMTTAMKDLWIRADVAAANDDVLKTAIVPKDFDGAWLPPASQKRLNALKN